MTHPDAAPAPAPAPEAPTDPTAVAAFGDDCGGLRERKKKLTRRTLHHAALQMVAEHGLDQVTTDEIAAAAGVSARTFFNYFPTKDAAVLGVPAGLSARLGEALLARPADEDLLTALGAVVRAWHTSLDADPHRTLRRTVIAGDPRLASAMITTNRDLEKALTDAARRRPHTPDDFTIRLTVGALFAATRASYLHTLDSNSDTGFVDHLDHALRMLQDGLK